MKLIKNGTVADPDWFYLDQASEGVQANNRIVPADLFLGNPDSYFGIQINVDTNLDHIAPFLDQLKLIVIEFAGYADGRGFSIAHRLRHSFGFTGKIWGAGSLISDQYVMAVQCGIDAVLVDEQLLQRQPIEHWQDALADAPTPYRYQDDMVQRTSVQKKTSNRTINDDTIAALNARFKNRQTKDLLSFVLDKNNLGNLATVSSFGTESVVLLHLIATTAPQTPILFLDTGKLFAETLRYQKELADKLGLSNIEILRPETVEVKQDDPQGNLWQKDTIACCNLRKVTPLRRALEGYDSWISGRKSHQSELRAPLQLFERSGHHIKINPLANWSHNQLVNYMKTHQLPAHPLVAEHFTSVGCVHCTTPIQAGEDTRAGRWRGMEKTECGIHLSTAN